MMKRFCKYLLIGVLAIGLFGCERDCECIEYMLYIENHSAEETIRLKIETSTSTDECMLGSHEMVCVKKLKVIATNTRPVLGSESKDNNPATLIHYFMLQDKVFDNLYYQVGAGTEEAWVKIEDTEDSPYRGANYKYDASISYGRKKCFVYQITDDFYK